MFRLNQINLSSMCFNVWWFYVCAFKYIENKRSMNATVAIYNQKGELNVMMWLRRRHQNVLHPYLIHLCNAIIFFNGMCHRFFVIFIALLAHILFQQKKYFVSCLNLFLNLLSQLQWNDSNSRNLQSHKWIYDDLLASLLMFIGQ